MAKDDKLHLFADESAAREHCPDDVILWMNAETGASYRNGSDGFGRGAGAYFCSKEARVARRRGRERRVYHDDGSLAPRYATEVSQDANPLGCFFLIALLGSIVFAVIHFTTSGQPAPKTGLYAGYWMSPKPSKYISTKDAVAATDAPATDSPDKAANSPSGPTEDSGHEARAAVVTYWQPYIVALASADVLIGAGAQSFSTGNTIEAQQFLRKASDYAGNAYDLSETNVPSDDDWKDISDNLERIALKKRDAISKLEDAIDSGSSEKGADAVEAASDERDRLAEQVHRVRVWLVNHGGDYKEVDDEQSAEKSLVDLIHLFGK